MILAITGDRNWGPDRYHEVENAILLCGPSRVILGDARGVDTLAREVCERHQIPHKIHYADWKKCGRAAGPIRNGEMLDAGPDALLYFHDDLDNSKGTFNCVKQARERGIYVESGI